MHNFKWTSSQVEQKELLVKYNVGGATFWFYTDGTYNAKHWSHDILAKWKIVDGALYFELLHKGKFFRWEGAAEIEQLVVDEMIRLHEEIDGILLEGDDEQG